TRWPRDWSSDVCSSDLEVVGVVLRLDLFEPQDHPNDFAYPGAPPTPPYDMAGWTLAYQMGVQFDRVLDGFDGPFEDIKGPVPPRSEERRVGKEWGWVSG